MNTFIQALEEQYNYKFTENGALAHRSTGSKVYDMFAFGAAYRERSIEDCILLFKNAFDEDPDLALKCLFYIRDCRGGQGERRFFRICLRWLAQQHPAFLIPLVKHIPEFGRWDDVFELFGTYLEQDACHFIVQQLIKDMVDCHDKKAISLLAKWMPSENAHSKVAKQRAAIIRKYVQASPREYRQMLSSLRAHLNILERLMSENRWDEIEYDKIPSKAGIIYRNAFARHDIQKKYEEFIKDKNTTVNAGTLYPYEVVEKVFEDINETYERGMYHTRRWYEIDDLKREVLNKYWANLPDYLNGASPSMLCVIDTSGSMYGRPLEVAISLGLYTAERMSGDFADSFITFSSEPQFVKTEGVDFVDKVMRIYFNCIIDNTNLTKVFDMLLGNILVNHVKTEDIPKTIVVISDMEIDMGSNWYDKKHALTEMESMREKWAGYGIEMPKLVYWNVNARNNTILDDGPGVSYVSGCSPTIYQSILTGKDGFDLMLDVLLGERYKEIKA